MALQLNPRPGRGLRDVFLRLLERAFQRFRLRHVADLSEMRGDRIGRPVGLREIDAFRLHDLDHGKGTGALREGVHQLLGKLPEVQSWTWPASQAYGSWGATWVYLHPLPASS